MRHILYFTADWCHPCQKTRPIAEDLDRDGIIKIIFIDVDTSQELLKDYGVKSVPTFILIEDGKEIHRVTGSQTREQLMVLKDYEKTI